MDKKPVLITLQEFANRISVSYGTARNMALSKNFCDSSISVNIRGNSQRGGTRIHWQKYLDYINTRPAVGEERRIVNKGTSGLTKTRR